VSKLPTGLSGKPSARALERVGFVVQRQRGSHMILRRENPFSRVTVPDHKTIRPGTLRSILDEAQLSIDDLNGLL